MLPVFYIKKEIEKKQIIQGACTAVDGDCFSQTSVLFPTLCIPLVKNYLEQIIDQLSRLGIFMFVCSLYLLSTRYFRDFKVITTQYTDSPACNQAKYTLVQMISFI